MSAGLTQAKREALLARRRLDETLGATRARMAPANLAGEAWDGVKDKSTDLADSALEAVKNRPAAASLALGALVLFLARTPIKRAVGSLFSGEDQEGIEDDEAALNEAEPA